MRKYSFIFIAILVSIVGAFIGSSTTHASPAHDRCTYLYDIEALVKTCEEGYSKATSDMVNKFCTQWIEPSEPVDGKSASPEQMTNACRAGMTEHDQAVLACVGTDQKKRQECENKFRPAQPPPSSTSAANSTGTQNTDVRKMPAGPLPTSGEVSKLGVPPDQRTKNNRCVFDGFFGTMVCGVMSVIGKMLDVSFSLLTGLLKTPPLLVTTGDGSYKAVYDVWVQFRNLANFAFVFAFLVIIYSHLTSVGVSNYSIKRMLPRLIIGALLVNLSFYLCGILIDLANILASSITSLISAFEPPKINGDIDNWEKIIGSMLFIGAGVVVLAAAAIYVNSAILIPIAASAIIVIGTTLVILLLRLALIPLFIILSPLAFAAIILPNTKGLFDKWRKVFIPLLMLHPVVALVFGGAHLASVVIQGVAISNDKAVLAVLALGIQIVPLFAIPWLMKLGGGALNQLGGITDTPVGKFREKANKYAEHRRNIIDGKAFRRSTEGHKPWDPRRLRDRAITRKAEREKKREKTDEALQFAGRASFGDQVNVSQDMPNDVSKLEQLKERASRGLYTAKGQKDKAEAARDTLLKKMAQTSDSETQEAAKHKVIKMKVDAHADSLKAARVSVDHTDLSRDQRLAIAMTGGYDTTDENGNVTGRYTASEMEREANIQKFADVGDIGAIIQIMKSTGNMTDQQKTTFTQTLRSNKKLGDKGPMLTNNTVLNMLEHGGANGIPAITQANFAEHVIGTSLAQDNYGTDQMANLDPDVAGEIANAISGVPRANNASGPIVNGLGPASKEQVEFANIAAKSALDDNNLSPRQRIVHNRAHLERIAK